MAANDIPCCETMFWVYLLVCVALVSFAGLMSGLTLGLMSLSLVDLEVLAKAGSPQDRRNAEKILPIVRNQHLLLCTLLIGNALAMEALPIFLDSLLSEWAAILISVTLILAFGEIIPQAVCSRHGLSVGARLSILVRLIVILLYPIAYPISKLLDLLIGKRHSALLRRGELKMLVSMHGNEAGKGGELTYDETTIISGALDMTLKSASDAMTPISKIFSLDINSRLDEKMMELIDKEGRSRVPIYSSEPGNIIGFILVKSLIKLRPEDKTPIRDLTVRSMPWVPESLSLYEILKIFQTGQSHMAAVFRSKEDSKKLSEAGKIRSREFKVNITTDNDDVEGVGFQSTRHNPVAINNASANNLYDHKSTKRDDVKIECHNLHHLSAKDEREYTYGCYTQNGDPRDANLEMIGIITLEDIMEELIQEEILDETDDYVDIHDRVRAHLISSQWLSRKSPPAWHLSSPLSSPSSDNNTSVLRSPLVSPNTQSAILGPSLRSPGLRFSAGSPAKSPGGTSCSQSPRSVYRKSYEKLTKLEASNEISQPTSENQ